MIVLLLNCGKELHIFSLQPESITEYLMFSKTNRDDDLDAPRVAQWEDDESEGIEAALNKSEQSQLVGGVLIRMFEALKHRLKEYSSPW